MDEVVGQETPARMKRLLGSFLLVIVLVPLGVRVVAQSTAAEYQLKAAFVSKFPEFTEWPDTALDGRDTIELCIARPNPFGPALAELTNGQSLRGRKLSTREVESPRDIDSCQLLFIPNLSAPLRRAFLGRAAMLPVLTVGDYPAFLNEGGVVNLRIANGRVRFDVNVEASNRVGVRLGSQLLRLAAMVRGVPQ